jgi:cytochrome c oxidase subunit III
MHESVTIGAQPAVGDGHLDGHDPHLAHHFDTARQQSDAGKLGMWLFLITEVLFFSGLFTAYAVYRSNHPEVFLEAHKYLDKVLGGVNTIVLLFSSLTMAWGVRCAQLGHKRGLTWCLTATLMCASLFLGIKAVEYTHKWDLGLYWGKSFAPVAAQPGQVEHGHSLALLYLCLPAALALVSCGAKALFNRLRGRQDSCLVAACLTLTALAFFLGVGVGKVVPAITDRWLPAEESARHTVSHQPPASLAKPPAQQLVVGDPQATSGVSLVGIFFSIYYTMTGIHAIHIIAGMLVIAWILARGVRGEFSGRYFAPVDYVGLYWHLVDLIWIYLFPLLYLIH